MDGRKEDDSQSFLTSNKTALQICHLNEIVSFTVGPKKAGIFVLL